MSPRAERWVKCPLKQEIRAALWDSYITRLTGGAALGSYLTLYTQPLIDVKHFTERGLITFDGEVYKGVVGVAYSKEAYAQSISQGQGRLELFLDGDIRAILTDRKSTPHKLLLPKFPFEAINLDYCNSIFVATNRDPISLHVRALETLFDIQDQKGCQRFCLFVTTRAETGQFAASFLSDLEKHIDQNIMSDPTFGQRFYDTYGVNIAATLQSSSYDDFATLGLIKLIVSMLSDSLYEVTDCNAIWLIRDTQGPYEGLLHLAFFIEKQPRQSPQPATRIRQYGRRRLQYQVRHLIDYMNDRATSGLRTLKESSDYEVLQEKHGEYIDRLASRTYQLKIPEPEQ